MNKYRFETTATMKPHNNKKWWIDPDIIRPVIIQAENVPDAMQLFRERVETRDYVKISNNAIKNPAPMYIDDASGEAIQTGYVITGKYDFMDDDRRRYTEQYIDLWTTIQIITTPDFPEA